MTIAYTQTEIEAIARGLIECSLPKPAWTHAAHFAAALWLLRHRGALAVRQMPAIIRAYNESTGVANSDASGYHETITLASLRAAYASLKERPEVALEQVLARLLSGPLGHRDWPLAYWSRERLFSVAARRSWLEPDLAPLPYPLILRHDE